MTPAEIRRAIHEFRSVPRLPEYARLLLHQDAEEMTAALEGAWQTEPDRLAALAALLAEVGQEGSLEFRIRRCAWEYLATSLFPLDAGSGFDRKAFWRHAFATAEMAASLAPGIAGVDQSAAYIGALLQDTGKLILESFLPRQFARSAELARTQGLFILEAERRELGVDHTLVGKWIAEAWQLPDAIAAAVWLHHHPPALITEEYPAALIHLVALSSQWARVRLRQPNTSRIPAAVEERRKRLDLSAEALTSLAPTPPPWERPQPAAASARSASPQDPAALLRDLRRLQAHFRLVKALACCGSTWEGLEILVEGLRANYGFPAGICLLQSFEDQEYAGKAWKSLEGPLEDLRLESGTGTPKSRAFSLLKRILRSDLRPGQALHEGLLVLPLRGPLGLSGQLVAEAAGARWSQPGGIQEVLDYVDLALQSLHRAYQLERAASRQESLGGTVWRQELQHQQQLKAERLASVSKLAAGAAHEINNPLAIISGQAQILLTRARHAEDAQALEQIVQQARRAGKVVQDLLNFARPAPPKLEQSELLSLVRRALDRMHDRFSQTGIRVDEDHARLLPRVLLDVEQMDQVLDHLLANALQAMPGGGVLTVRTRATRDRKSIVLQIADTGTGIPPELMNQVFEPFFSLWDHGKGAGLGLPLCHAIVESHRGAIALHSQPGEGATCIITLPAAAEVALNAIAGQDRPKETHAFTLLLADRQEELRTVLREALEARGIVVRLAGDSLEAMAVLMAHAVDAVLLDMQLYTPRGLSLLQQIRERYPNLPILALGHGSTEESEDAVAQGAVACLQKPFRLEQLLLELERFTGQRNVA